MYGTRRILHCGAVEVLESGFLFIILGRLLVNLLDFFSVLLALWKRKKNEQSTVRAWFDTESFQDSASALVDPLF